MIHYLEQQSVQTEKYNYCLHYIHTYIQAGVPCILTFYSFCRHNEIRLNLISKEISLAEHYATLPLIKFLATALHAGLISFSCQPLYAIIACLVDYLSQKLV